MTFFKESNNQPVGQFGEVVAMIREMAIDGGQVEAKLIDTGDDRKLVYLRNDGDMIEYTKRLPPRKHKIASIDDFIVAVQKHWVVAKSDGEIGPWGANPIVWHNDNALMLFPDDEDRRDSVTVDLLPSAQLNRLKTLVSEPGKPAKRISQGDLLELIRIDLNDCVADRQKIETLIRNVNFKRTESGGAVMQRGQESFDSDIQMEVIGWTDAPEFVQVTIPIYRNPGENIQERRYTVLCAFDIDVEDRAFIFRPVPNGLQEAIDAAQVDIRHRIVKAAPGIPIYNGVA